MPERQRLFFLNSFPEPGNIFSTRLLYMVSANTLRTNGFRKPTDDPRRPGGFDCLVERQRDYL